MSSKAILLNPVCLKTLSAVEAYPDVSRQHEFNGVAPLKAIFGLERTKQLAKFSVRGGGVLDEVMVTWYDSRENDPVRSEHRLYFQTNDVMDLAQAGDNMLIGLDDKGLLNFILIKS